MISNTRKELIIKSNQTCIAHYSPTIELEKE